MKKIVLLGAGGHCKSCIDVILASKQFEIVAILGKNSELNRPILNFKVNGNDGDIAKYLVKDCSFLITVGQIKSNATRLKLYNKLIDLKASFATVISPLAYVSDFAQIGQGSIVMHHAIINADAKIGQNCIINSKALIEHDASISDHCHISTAAVVNGEVKVGQNSFVGSHATTKQGIEIPQSSFIKAGALVK